MRIMRHFVSYKTHTHTHTHTHIYKYLYIYKWILTIFIHHGINDFSQYRLACPSFPDNTEYETCSRTETFDINILESLFKSCWFLTTQRGCHCHEDVMSTQHTYDNGFVGLYFFRYLSQAVSVTKSTHTLVVRHLTYMFNWESWV